MKTIDINEIKISELQQRIRNLIAAQYSGYKIENAFKVNQNDVITYDVNLTRGTQTIILSFDKNCSFIAIIAPIKKRIIKLLPETDTKPIHNKFKQNPKSESYVNYLFTTQ